MAEPCPRRLSVSPQATHKRPRDLPPSQALAEPQRSAALERLKIANAPLAHVEPALQFLVIVGRATVPAGEDESVAHECLPFEPVTDVAVRDENNLLGSYSATLEIIAGQS